jgi:AraC-like DNA-binding protein
MKAGRINKLSDIAYELGYTDQSHFIKDTKEFTRYTPKSLSQAVDECGRMTLHRTLVRQRILIQQCGEYLDQSRDSKNAQQFRGI